MKLEQSTQAKINKLAESINDEPLDIKPSSHSGPVLVKTQSAGNVSRMFTLSGMQAKLYLDVLESLGKEIVLEHLTRAELDNALTGLVVDLDSNSQQAPREIRQRVDAFVSEIARLPLDYEVIFVIEPIILNSESLTIGDVVFQKLTHEIAEEWKFAKGEFTNQAVGIVKVKAGTAGKALERAQILFDRALNILRVCISSSNPKLMIWDKQLLQRRRLSVIRQLGDQSALVEARPDRGFNPLQVEVSGVLADSTNEFIERLTPLYNGTIQDSLRDALLRSLEWIGLSITREDYDDKVVTLLTALEVALVTKKDWRKGETVAFRVMLLSLTLENGYFVPSADAVYRLYGLRNAIMHDADRGKCGEEDYRTLRRIAQRTILNIIELNGKQGPIDDVRHLAKILETEEILKQAKARFEDWRNREHAEDVKGILNSLSKRAEEKLAKLRSTTRHTSGQSE